MLSAFGTSMYFISGLAVLHLRLLFPAKPISFCSNWHRPPFKVQNKELIVNLENAFQNCLTLVFSIFTFYSNVRTYDGCDRLSNKFFAKMSSITLDDAPLEFRSILWVIYPWIRVIQSNKTWGKCRQKWNKNLEKTSEDMRNWSKLKESAKRSGCVVVKLEETLLLSAFNCYSLVGSSHLPLQLFTIRHQYINAFHWIPKYERYVSVKRIKYNVKNESVMILSFFCFVFLFVLPLKISCVQFVSLCHLSFLFLNQFTTPVHYIHSFNPCLPAPSPHPPISLLFCFLPDLKVFKD